MIRALLTGCGALASAAAVGSGLFLGSAMLMSQTECGVPPLIGRLHGIQIDLASRECSRGTFVLGSSIGLEGIDCDAVSKQESALSPCRNYSRGGASPRQWLLLLPSVVDASPRRVVLTADVPSLNGSAPIPPEVLAAAAAWRIRAVLTEPSLRGLLSSAETEVLDSGPIATIAHFRPLPLMTLDTFARETVRADLRFAGHAHNFTAPWVRQSDISGRTLDRHIAVVADGIAGLKNTDVASGLALLRVQAEFLRRRGIAVIGVVTPVNPAVRAAVGDEKIAGLTNRMLAAFRAAGAVPLDESRLLSASEFGDAVHPNAQGRAKWSEALGVSLRALE